MRYDRDILDEFADARRENLAALRSLGLVDADLDRTGMHPGLGRVTLRQLLAAWVAHDLGHLAQIARVMAKQYSDEVGPWSRVSPRWSKIAVIPEPGSSSRCAPKLRVKPSISKVPLKPPIQGYGSKTSTRWPCLVSSAAAVRPAGPAPMTTTSGAGAMAATVPVA